MLPGVAVTLWPQHGLNSPHFIELASAFLRSSEQTISFHSVVDSTVSHFPPCIRNKNSSVLGIYWLIFTLRNIFMHLNTEGFHLDLFQ